MTSKLSNYSTTPASNNAASPNGWAEGALPSTINDCNREYAARVREWYEDPEWIDLGHTIVSSTGTSIKVSGDQTGAYLAGRAIRVNQSASQDGWIAASAYSAPDTSITVSGFTVSSPTQVEVGAISSATSLPNTVVNTSTVQTLPNGSAATTQSTGDSSNKVATNAFVQQEIDANKVIVGRAYTSNGTYSRITTAAFLDDTAPLATEGDDVMTITRSALSGTNRYQHTVTIVGTCFQTSVTIASVWQGSTLIHAVPLHGVGGYEDRGSRTFSFENVPGTTAAATFTVQIGVANPGYFDLNGYNGGRVLGGSTACTYSIKEIKA